MTVPVQVQLFDAFGGTQEGIHSLILPDIFSSGGSKNLYMDKYARAKKISGYSKQNAVAVTTDTGGSATLMRAISPYRATSGGTTVRHIIGVFDDGTDEWEIWKSTDTGATFTFLNDAGAGSVGKNADFAQFGDTLYITNGVFVPKKYDGTTLGVSGRTQSPTVTSAAGAAGVLAGNFKWKLVSMIGGVRQAGGAPSTSLALQDKQASLTWTADANGSVTGYELYRTTGTGSVYYFVKYIDLRATVAYTDNTSDLTLLENRVMVEHGDPPPVCYYCEPHKQRMWWGRTDTFPTRAYWSDPGLAEDVLADNYLDFSDGETIGDSITGMLGNVEGKLIVFTERAVWTVSGTGQVIGNIDDWTRIKTNAQIGCVSGKTAMKIPAGAKYADQEGKLQVTTVVTTAYLTPLSDIRIFDGDNDVIVSHPVRATLQTLNYASRAKSFAVSNGDIGEIAWCFPAGSNGEPSTAVVWNYRWGVWYVREWGFSCGVEVETSADSSILLAGSRATATGGYCYQLNNGNTFDGSAIEARWMTKTLYGVNQMQQPAISNTKRWRWVDFLFETEQSAMLTVEWFVGNSPDTAAALGTVTVNPAAETLITVDGDTVLTLDGDSIVVSVQSTGLRVQLKTSDGSFLHDTGIRFRVGDNASNGSWSVEGMNVAYQILPGLQRRMQ